MNKVLWIVLAVITLAAAIFSIVMTVMAVKFMEYGRVLFYSTVFIVSLEVFVIAVAKLKKS